MSFKIKRFLFISIISMSVWAAVTLLSHSSSHIIIYVAFLFYQAVIVTNYFVKKYPVVQIPFVLLLTCIIITNAFNLFTNYFALSKSSPRLIFAEKIICLDNSTLRIYKDHNKIPSKPPCERSEKR